MFDIFGGCDDNLPCIKHVTRQIGIAATIGACQSDISRLGGTDRSEVRGQRCNLMHIRLPDCRRDYSPFSVSQEDATIQQGKNVASHNS